MICLTIDLEWSPDELIKPILKALDDHSIKATFFATHNHKVKIGAQHEIALHPNLTAIEKHHEKVNELLKIFPQAKGFRGHSLATDERLLATCQNLGLVYQSAYLMIREPNIRPFEIECGITEIPVYYMDSIHFRESERFDSLKFSLASLKLNQPGLKVLIFHPIHIFLNTDKVETYLKAKPYYQQPKMLKKYRNTKNRGVGDIFNETLNYLSKNQPKTLTLSEIYDQFHRSIILYGSGQF